MSSTVWATDTPTELKAYGRALVELAAARPEVVCIGADLTGPTETDLFRDTIGERFFNLGMAEANAVGVAAGMARAGDTPFVHTFSVFATRRAFDQIAMQVAYPRANVKLPDLLRRDITIQAVWLRRFTFQRAVALLPELPVARLLSHRILLARIGHALDLLRSGEAVKVVVEP